MRRGQRRTLARACVLSATAVLAAGCADLGIGSGGREALQAEVARLTRQLTAAQAEIARLNQQADQAKRGDQLRAQELALRVQELRHTEQALLRMANQLGGAAAQPWTPATPGGPQPPTWPANPQPPTPPGASPPPTWPTSPQALTGKVTGVDMAAGIVVIDRGQLHGAKKGDSLVVERAGHRIGKIIVDAVYPDASSARVVSGEMKGTVAVGDTVRTMRPGD